MVTGGGAAAFGMDFIVYGRLRILRLELLESIEYVELVRAKLMFDDVFVVCFACGLSCVLVLTDDLVKFDLTTMGGVVADFVDAAKAFQPLPPYFGLASIVVIRTVFSSFFTEFFNSLSFAYVMADVLIVLPDGVLRVDVVVVRRSRVCGL